MQAPQAVSCWLEANLPASAIFLQVLWLVWLFLEPWPQQLSEQKSSVAFVLKTAISNVEIWGYFFFSKDAVSLNASGDKYKECQNF